MSIFQIVIVLVTIIIIYKAFIRFRRKEINAFLLGMWILFWIMILIIDLQPNIINFIANFVGIGRGVDLVIYISLFVIFYLFFCLLVRINKIDKNISELTRKIALDEFEKNKQAK